MMEKIKWQFDVKILKNQNGFLFSETGGIINPLESVNVKVEFNPTKPSLYHLKIPLIINDREEEMNICLSGEGAYPKPMISVENLILPVVPLGITTYAYISLRNRGYANGTMQAVVPEEALKNGLSIIFVEGQSFSPVIKKLPIKVSFVSN